MRLLLGPPRLFHPTPPPPPPAAGFPPPPSSTDPRGGGIRILPLSGGAAPHPFRIAAQSGSHGFEPSSVEMVQGRDGVWSSAAERRRKAGETTVVVLWDLDNKPPRGPPYEAAAALRQLAGLFGRVVEVAAYANRHAFLHLPQWIRDQRRERKLMDEMEQKGHSVAAEPYLCGVCGRKFEIHADLRKHFKQLHERERQKKLGRMRSLKGKKRRNFRERYISGNFKYEEAARDLIKPKAGFGLAAELRRAGVFVKMVADKPQAADAALKRQVQHSMSRGIDWIFLVSDDSDFSEMLRRARESNLRTVVIGDGRTALSRQADLWFPWMGVENGEVGEDLAINGRPLVAEEMEVSFSNSDSDLRQSDWAELSSVVDEIVTGRSIKERSRVSAFSDDEVAVFSEDDDDDDDDDDLRLYGSSLLSREDIFYDSEEEEEDG